MNLFHAVNCGKRRRSQQGKGGAKDQIKSYQMSEDKEWMQTKRHCSYLVFGSLREGREI